MEIVALSSDASGNARPENLRPRNLPWSRRRSQQLFSSIYFDCVWGGTCAKSFAYYMRFSWVAVTIFERGGNVRICQASSPFHAARLKIDMDEAWQEFLPPSELLLSRPNFRSRFLIRQRPMHCRDETTPRLEIIHQQNPYPLQSPPLSTGVRWTSLAETTQLFRQLRQAVFRVRMQYVARTPWARSRCQTEGKSAQRKGIPFMCTKSGASARLLGTKLVLKV